MEYLTREAADARLAEDGRHVHVLLVPWNAPAEVADVIDGRAVRYREQFAPGAFDRAAKAPHRVALTYGHSESFGDVLGFGRSITNEPDGAHGVFRLNEHDAPRAAAIIGDLGVSVRFMPLTPKLGAEREGQLVTRRAVHLVHAALVRQPAYSDARVLAIREADEQAAAEAAQREADREAEREFAAQLIRSRDLGVTLTPEMSEWLAERGYSA